MDPIKCSGCKMLRPTSSFETDRLGLQRKTCILCKQLRLKAKCVHGRWKYGCHDCEGSCLCEHARQRHRCKDCNGASICEHHRVRHQCKECEGASFCEHNQMRYTCVKCAGSGICEHGKRKFSCKTCGGPGICTHGKVRSVCVKCAGGNICTHAKRRQSCAVCDPAGHLKGIVAARVQESLKSQKSRGSLEYLGCNIDVFRSHLEAKFEAGMTWINYGTWQIDHIIPIKYPGAGGGPPTLDEVISRLHYSNTQPMWSKENMAKGNRWMGGPLPDVQTAPEITAEDFAELLAAFDL